MLKRMTVSFTLEEREALDRLARQELRPPKEQVRFLLRAEAERRGLWPVVPVVPAQPVDVKYAA